MKQHTGNLVKSVKRGVIIQQVNAQGVMGSGIAGQLRNEYPQIFTDYVQVVGQPYTQPNAGRDHLGKVIISGITPSPELIVVGIVGQQFFGREAKRYTSYDALDAGFEALAKTFLNIPIEFHHPAIGCGLGGGDWNVVQAIIERHLGHDTHLWTLPLA